VCRGLSRTSEHPSFKVTPPMLYRLAYGQSLQIIRIGVAAFGWITLLRQVRDWLKSSSLVLQHDCYNSHCQSISSHGEHHVLAASGSITYGANMSRNLRVSKASKYVGVNATLCGWDFHSKSVNGALRSLR
jgi:hypothetical protein